MDGKLLVIFSIKSVAAALEKAIDLSSSSQVVLVPCVMCTVYTKPFTFRRETGPAI